MEDRVAIGLGSQAGDCEVKGHVRPVWFLDPLPLPEHEQPRSHAKSALVTLCVDNISRNFDLYTPKDLSGLGPTLLSRLMFKVRKDREYNALSGYQDNPDQTTIWAYSALTNAEANDTAKDHTLAVPQEPTLTHLAPNPHAARSRREHPLLQLPKLYAAINTSPLSLLTTLSLDGADNIVNDQTVLNLRYCTHLTALWTRGCGISDTAVRVLAAALDLEEKRGMWSLRAWFAPGCKGVTDRSMQSFAKWPGLTCLDVRHTSVTEVGIDIFNRSSRSVFDNRNADFQPCTLGLTPIFDPKASVEEVVESLALTLLKPPTQELERWWIALHVVPSYRPVDPAYLPYPPKRTTARRYGSTTQTYRSEFGQVYGSDVAGIQDTVTNFRHRLSTAMRLQNEEEGLVKRQVPWWEAEKRERKKMGRLAASEKTQKPPTYKTRPGEGHKKGNNGAKKLAGYSPQGIRIEGQECFMLVRMVYEHWQDLRWSGPSNTQSTALSSTPAIARASSSNLVGDILGTQAQVRTRPSQSSSPSRPPRSSPDTKLAPPDTLIKTPSTPAHSGEPGNPFKAPVNPFKQGKSHGTNQLGVRPLSSSLGATKATTTLSTPSQPLSTERSPILFPSTPNPTLSQSSLNFGTGTKRRFQGSDTVEPKRGTMKMFTLNKTQ